MEGHGIWHVTDHTLSTGCPFIWYPNPLAFFVSNNVTIIAYSVAIWILGEAEVDYSVIIEGGKLFHFLTDSARDIDLVSFNFWKVVVLL